MPIIIVLIIFILMVVLFLYLLPSLLLAIILYRLLLVRTSKAKWSGKRKRSRGTEKAEMYSRGIEWAANERKNKQEVTIRNNDLKLQGDFFYFGSRKAVIIIPGLGEGRQYSYYYAAPYKNLGYNVLVIDNRCNGSSDGKYLTFGIKEYTDILLWADFLHMNYDIDSILLHGICIGAATALFTLTAENCPDYLKGMVADGMYASFYEIFKSHVVNLRQPTFPVPQIVFFFVKHISKVDARNNGPLFCIDQLNKPILFIHSKKDKFSLPGKTEEIYDKCPAPKQIVWFEDGKHSHLRITDESKYDEAIYEFVKNLE